MQHEISDNDDDDNGEDNGEATPAALIHSCVLSAEGVLKLVKPFAQQTNHLKLIQRQSLIYLLCHSCLSPDHSCRTGEASVDK